MGGTVDVAVAGTVAVAGNVPVRVAVAVSVGTTVGVSLTPIYDAASVSLTGSKPEFSVATVSFLYGPERA